jgi:hypothetical protein
MLAGGGGAIAMVGAVVAVQAALWVAPIAAVSAGVCWAVHLTCMDRRRNNDILGVADEETRRFTGLRYHGSHPKCEQTLHGCTLVITPYHLAIEHGPFLRLRLPIEGFLAVDADRRCSAERHRPLCGPRRSWRSQVAIHTATGLVLLDKPMGFRLRSLDSIRRALRATAEAARRRNAIEGRLVTSGRIRARA